MEIKVKPLAWKSMVNSAGDPVQLTCAWCDLFQKHFYAERPQDQARVEARRARKILAQVSLYQPLR